MPLTHNEDHAGALDAEMSEQFRSVTKLVAMLEAFATQAQEVEDALWALYTQRGLSGVGTQLDVAGKWLLETRDGDDDAAFLIRLSAKVRVLRSNGTVPNLLAVFVLLLPDNALVFLDRQHASFLLDIGQVIPAFVPLYARFTALAKSAGVNAQLLWTDTAPDQGFTFDDVNNPGSTPGLGWGDVSDASVGGVLSTVAVGSI